MCSGLLPLALSFTILYLGCNVITSFFRNIFLILSIFFFKVDFTFSMLVIIFLLTLFLFLITLFLMSHIFPEASIIILCVFNVKIVKGSLILLIILFILSFLSLLIRQTLAFFEAFLALLSFSFIFLWIILMSFEYPIASFLSILACSIFSSASLLNLSDSSMAKLRFFINAICFSINSILFLYSSIIALFSSVSGNVDIFSFNSSTCFCKFSIVIIPPIF